jgi:mono/diheme cytochrome c family protein
MIERYVSPSEFKRLLSALLVVIIFLALLAVFAFLVLPGVRNANAPATDMVVSPAGGGTGWLDPTDYPAEAGRTVPPIDPATVMTPNPEILARGQVLYAQNCVSCHGPKGEGDGPAGKGLKPSPRRFTHPEDWVNGSRIDGIYKTLDQGIKGSSMVAYTMLTKRDRMALVHYVRSLGRFDHGPEDPKALRALADLFAHSGEVIPNRIPVPRAMAKLETEAAIASRWTRIPRWAPPSSIRPGPPRPWWSCPAGRPATRPWPRASPPARPATASPRGWPCIRAPSGEPCARP